MPIRLAKALGNITAGYRWFAIVYILSCFFVLPLFVFGLSLAGWQVLVGVGVPLVVMIIVIIVINVLQSKCPRCLPTVLHSWDFLPLWAHSLAPWDRVVKVMAVKCCCCCKCCQPASEGEGVENKLPELEMYDNPVIPSEVKPTKKEKQMHLSVLQATQL